MLARAAKRRILAAASPDDRETEQPTDAPAPPGDLTSAAPRPDSPFSTDPPEDPADPVDPPEPGSDLPLDGDFVSLAVGQLDGVDVNSVYDQKESQDVCGSYFRVARSDGMGNTLTIEGWSQDGLLDLAVRLDQLKRVEGHWQRLVAYVGPDFLDTEYSVDVRTQSEGQGDVVIHIARAIGIGPSENGWVEGDLFVRMRGSCIQD